VNFNHIPKFEILGCDTELALPLCKKGSPAPGLVRLVPFQRLMRFYLFIALTALRKVLRVIVANPEMSTHPRMQQGGWRVMPSARKRGLGERENKPGVPSNGWKDGGGVGVVGWTPL
jgi:hypothetical protein